MIEEAFDLLGEIVMALVEAALDIFTNDDREWRRSREAVVVERRSL